MNDFSESRHHARQGRRTGASKLVRLRIALSGRHPPALLAIEARLDQLVESAGITAGMTGQQLTLVRASHPITPAEWSAVIGWLLCQPEVVFVARELPLTRSCHATR
jgi:hypothetical protein